MKRSGNLILWTVVLIMIIAASSVVYSKYASTNKSSRRNINGETRILQIDQKITAPDFALKDLNDKEVKLSDYKGKIVILNFWASWCPPCRGEMPDLNDISKELQKGKDAVLLTINATDGSRETVDKARKYISDNKFTMPVLLDIDTKVTEMYGIQAFPTTIVINKDGTVYGGVEGPVSQQDIFGVVSNIISKPKQ